MKRLQSFLKRPFVKRGNERGIALVFTLGILGLLIVIALAFSSSAITERKAAYNNDARSLARILSQSGLNRAMAAMMYYSTVSDSFDKLFSHDSSTNTVDYIYKLSTTLDGDSISVNGMSDLQWQYVYNGKTGTTSDSDCSRIVGRYAYVVAPSGGYLDPSEVVDSGSGTLLSESSASKERPGVSISEIYVPGLTDNTSDLSNTEITNLSDTSAGGLKTHNGRWADMDSLFSALGISDITKKQKWATWFAVPAAEDKEVYWIDTGDTGTYKKDKIDDSSSNHELFKRFNLSRTDWDTMTIADILADKVYYADSGTPGIRWIRNFGISDAGADDSTYKGTFSTIQKRRCQIAANLLDYCKNFTQQVTNGKVSGSYPTVTASSILPSAWSSANFPDFTGNKKTYYLNELGFKFLITSTVTQIYDDPPTNSVWHWVCQLELKVQPGAEIINLYGTSCNNASSNVQILLDGASVSWTPALSDSSPTVSYTGSISLPGTISSAITAFSSGTGSVSYFPAVASNFWAAATTTLDTATATTGSGTASAPSWSVNSLGVSIPCMILQYDGNTSKRYDCSNLTGASATSVVTSSAGITTNNTDYYYVSYEAIDPRQNLNPGDWYVPSSFTKGSSSTPTSYTGTPAVVNSKSSPASCFKSTTDYGSDTETATDPISLSTRYIREAPMQSPWELGFIHRGAAWETINLRQYNTFNSSSRNGLSDYAGGARYAYTNSTLLDGGDANILDEIKMSDLDQMFGKVNVKTANNDVLKSLFFYVKYGTSPLEYASGTPAYTTCSGLLGNSNNYHDGFATGVRSYAATKGIKTRAMLANANGMTADYSGYGLSLSRSNKAAQEEILGKIINLTKVEAADTFSIVVLAQAIRDAGSKDGIPINKDLNGDGSIGSSVSVPNVDSGSTPGSSIARTGVNETCTCKLGTYDFGFDEILAEQKIYAVFRKTTAGKWRIVRYEYVDPGSDAWTP